VRRPRQSSRRRSRAADRFVAAPQAASRPDAGAAPAAPDNAVAAPATDAASATAGATAGTLRLDFRFAQDSWIEIFDGTGKAVLYDLGAAGTVRTISAVPPLSVTVGNAPAVALSVNGQAVALPRPEPGQTVVRVRVERGGVVR
jgi:cytoskeleton protein RodZ